MSHVLFMFNRVPLLCYFHHFISARILVRSFFSASSLSWSRPLSRHTSSRYSSVLFRLDSCYSTNRANTLFYLIRLLPPASPPSSPPFVHSLASCSSYFIISGYFSFRFLCLVRCALKFISFDSQLLSGLLRLLFLLETKRSWPAMVWPRTK